MNHLTIAIKNKTNLTLKLEKLYNVTYYKKQSLLSSLLLRDKQYPEIYFHKGYLSSEAVLLIENSKLVIVSSESMKREIVNKLSNIDISKLHVIYPYLMEKNEYDKGIKQEFKNKHGIDKDTKILFFRGNDLSKCGMNFLKDALSRMYEKNFILIIESNLKQVNMLKLQIERSNVNFQYLLLSDYEDISEVFISADIFILPTLQKYFAQDVLKAMHYKNAVFVTESNPSSELIDVFSLIQGEEDRSASFKIDSLLLNKSEMKKIQKDNYDISKKYSLDNSLQKVLKLIKESFDI